VNVIIPGGSPTGDAVPIVLGVAGQISSAVAVAAR
jgi:hypothetical protein